jgi:hypothetical protein
MQGESTVRLTLRTLLAYLDDTLEPAQAKVIGQKIAESPTAQELIDRIKEVVRRRRLMPPPITGPDAKLDPNTIAEYIDSVLPADQLADVEETCLESDVYLAEIAACHQILTIILSEPALVPPTAKQRMYALIQGPEAIPYRKAGRSGAEDGAAATSSPERNEADDALLLGLPLYRGQGPWYRRLAPIAGVLLLFACLAVAIWKALPGGGPSKKVIADGQVAQAGPSSIENVATPRTNGKEVKTTQPTPEEVKPKPAPEEVKPTKPAAEDSKTIVPAPEATKPSKPPAEDVKPTNPPSEEVKPAPAVAREHKVVGKYSSPAEAEPDVLLQRSDAKAPWKRLGHNDPVSTEDYLVTLPGYRSRVQLERGVQLTLWGSLADPADHPALVRESAVVLHDSPDVDLDLTLDHGRIAVANREPGSKRVRVRFHDESWELTLDGPSEVALELWGKPEPGFSREGKGDGPAAFLGLFVLKGQVQLKIRYDTHFMREPKGPALFAWSNIHGPAPAPIYRESLPPWAEKPVPSNQPPATVQALRSLSKRLKGPVAVDVILAEMVRDQQNGPGQVLGIMSLGAIEDLPDLLEVLADEHHAAGRQTALGTLRHYLGQHAENNLKLFKALENRYRTSTAEIIMVLLHEYTPENLAKPETYEQLIEYLVSDTLPIRALASWQLHYIQETQEIAKRIPYDPAGGVDQRTAAHDEWKKYIPDGKLPPKGPVSPPKKKDK